MLSTDYTTISAFLILSLLISLLYNTNAATAIELSVKKECPTDTYNHFHSTNTDKSFQSLV
jgi:hypothetical protein